MKLAVFGIYFPNVKTPWQPLSSAILRILRVLVRILLHHGVGYQAFADLAKWVYVDVATNMEEFGIEGRKQSISRAAVITGLSRREVVRVRGLPSPDDDHTSAQKLTRAARVIAAWLREPDFLDGEGKPKMLPVEGSGASFSELVRRRGGDMLVRPILDELVRAGTVEQLEDGHVRLVVHSYIPQASEPAKLYILGTDVAFLLSTIAHNLVESDEPQFQRKVMYDNLPDNVLSEFRELSASQAQSMLDMWGSWLAKHDRDETSSVEGKGRNRAGIGIYYFEEPYEGGV